MEDAQTPTPPATPAPDAAPGAPEAHAAAAAPDLDRLRDELRALNPQAIPALIAGATVAELLDSIGPARAAWQQAQPPATPPAATPAATPPAAPPATPPAVPDGAAAFVDPGALSAAAKIRRGLTTAG